MPLGDTTRLPLTWRWSEMVAKINGQGAADWKQRREELKLLGMRVLDNALRIADDAVRSDVELYAKAIPHPEGGTAYDLRHPEATLATSDTEQARAVAVAQRAARYIGLRGDAFPWSMVYIDGTDYLVRFVDKESKA